VGVSDQQKTLRSKETSLQQDRGELSCTDMGCCTNEEKGQDKSAEKKLAEKKNEDSLVCEKP